MTKKYHLITFGCQINKSDSERIAGTLEKIGYKSATPDVADLIVVNMCSVRQSAVDRVYGLVPKFKKLRTKNYKLQTILTGCFLKKDKTKFRKQFDLILSIKNLKNWPKYLSSHKKYVKVQPKYSNKFSAYIPIMCGCNNFCSYCVVPYTRGPEICKPANQIIKQVKQLVKKGFKEIWLLGHNVNSYGIHRRTDAEHYAKPTQNKEKVNFAKLLKMANNIPGNFWISFTSSHPNDFSDELIKIIAESNKISKYISLPIQSGDNEILKKMNRPYTVEQYKKIIKKIRKKIPNIYLSTDIIVGFPGETKKQFNNTKKLFKQIKFDMAYIAEYSPRPGTAAFKLEDNVPHKEKQKRREKLTKILEKTSMQNSKKYINKTLDVLIHETTKKGDLVGKTCFYKTVKIPCKQKSAKYIGKIIKSKIINTMPWGLKGKLIS